MVILGVDPGYATTGFGLIRAERGTYALLRYGTVTTPAGLPFPQRLNILFEDMTQLLEVTKPEAVAVEDLLRLDRMPRPDDAADAIAIALCHARSSTSQLARLMGGKP